MLTEIHPKLPMRDKAVTLAYYANLGFAETGSEHYPDYLMVKKDQIQIHFFEFKKLNPRKKEKFSKSFERSCPYRWILILFSRSDWILVCFFCYDWISSFLCFGLIVPMNGGMT